MPDQKQDDQKQESADTQKQPTPEPSYIAHVRLGKNWINTETGRSLLGPGMMVTTEIQTGRRRIIDYLLSPLQRKVSESLHER
jgi:hemolysin D